MKGKSINEINFAESADYLTLTRAIGYQFNDPTLLWCALVHRSLSERNLAQDHGPNNERMEFLGDAVLSVITANYLYRQNNYFDEGDLSRLRAQYVCEQNLSLGARKLDLGKFIKSDKAMRVSGSNNSKSVLADTLEAVIGAVFIDGGLMAAEDVLFRVLDKPSLKLAQHEKDAKTKLQEIMQANVNVAPKYVVLEASGPAHAPTFLVGVKIKDEIFATATGVSKRSAAQNAALRALEKLSLTPVLQVSPSC